MLGDKQQREIFGKYIGSPSNDQLSLYFHLNDDDKSLIETMRRPSTKLGFAVQLGTVRFLGVFPKDFMEIPLEIFQYLAAQLSIDPNEIYSYTRQATQFQHTKIIREQYGYRGFADPDVEIYLSKWLSNRSIYTTETNKMLFDMLLNKCLDEKILLPGISTFERFIARIVEASEKELYKQLAGILTNAEKKRLLDLLELVCEPVQGATIKMDILRSPLIDESQKEITRGFNRLLEFQSFHTEAWNLSSIPEGKIKDLAAYTFKAKAQTIQRMSTFKKLAHLIAFIYEYQKKAMDEQLLALSKYFDSIFRRAKNKEMKERMRSLKDLDRSAFMLSQIVELIFNESIDNNKIRNVILETYPQSEVNSAVSQVKNLVRNEQEPIAISELQNSYRKFRKFIPNILATLEFEGNNYGVDILTVWELIRKKFPKPITLKNFYNIEKCFPKKWQYYIKKNPSSVNQCVLIAGIELLIQGLKRHDIFVEKSKKYVDPMKYLLDKSTWEQQRNILIDQLKLPNTGYSAVKKLTEDLSLSFEEAGINWDTSSMARIEEHDGKMKIIVSKLRKTYEHQDEKAFKIRVRQLMPTVDLPDLLLEVNQRLKLTQSFNHISENESRMKNLDISILAVLLAEACNIGFSPVSKNNVESLKYARLVYVDHQYGVPTGI